MDVDTEQGYPVRMKFNITGFPTIIYFEWVPMKPAKLIHLQVAWYLINARRSCKMDIIKSICTRAYQHYQKWACMGMGINPLTPKLKEYILPTF